MSLPQAGPSPVSLPASFEIKSAQLQLEALLVKTSDLGTLVTQLLAAYGPLGENPDFFDHDALVLDFSAIPPEAPTGDLALLLDTLKQCRLLAVAAAPEAEIKEIIREVPGPATMVVDKPLRSGQKIYARGADLVVLAMVNQGAEVAADGNIHVYAPLRGKAMAGARGNTQARIFSLCLEPELVSIAGVYRTSENAFPADVHGKPAQVRLSSDGKEKLLIEALKN